MLSEIKKALGENTKALLRLIYFSAFKLESSRIYFTS